LCAAYDKMFDQQQRIAAIREVDGIVANDYQYVLLWYAPYIRLAYWNKFGVPPGYLSRIGDQYMAYQLWWDDPDKDAKMQEALHNQSIKLEVGPDEDHYWDNYGKTQQTSQK
jgi:hypothetical protein